MILPPTRSLPLLANDICIVSDEGFDCTTYALEAVLCMAEYLVSELAGFSPADSQIHYLQHLPLCSTKTSLKPLIC